MNVRDYLNRDDIKQDIEELLKVMDDQFDDLDAVGIIYKVGDEIKWGLYGKRSGLVGMLEMAKLTFLLKDFDLITDKGDKS